MSENYGYCIGIDMAGFSKKSVKAQKTLVKCLNKLLTKVADDPCQIINTGDGAFIIFPDEAYDIDDVIKAVLSIMDDWHLDKDNIGLRMGIGAGVIIPQKDARGNSNFIGDGINLTARIMDCGNEGHILLSQLIALEIERKPDKIPEGYSIVYMGEYVVKHSLVLDIYALIHNNLKSSIPNRNIPIKSRAEWEKISKEASNIVFPKMETLAKLSTLPPEARKNLSWGKDYDFIVANAQIHLQREGHRVIAHIHIDDYPFVATDKKSRLLLESDEISDRHGKTVLLEGFKRGRLDNVTFNGRFSAGGAIGIINCKNSKNSIGTPEDFILVTVRDEGAPNYPNSLGPASGLSETLAEWVYPKLTVYREFVEEVLITVREGNTEYILMPSFICTEDNREILNTEFKETKERFQKKYHKNNLDVKEAIAKLIPLGNDALLVSWGMKEEPALECNLVIDSERGIIDIIEGIRVDLSNYSIGDITIYDVEKKKGKDIVTNRDVLLFTIEEFCKLSIPGEKAKYIQRWKSGKNFITKSKAKELPKTPKMAPPLHESVIPLARALNKEVAETINQMRYVHNDQRSFVSIE